MNGCTYLGFNLSLKKSRIVLPAACSALSLFIALALANFQVVVNSLDEEVGFGTCWYLDDTFTEVTFDIAENLKSLSSSAIFSRCLI